MSLSEFIQPFNLPHQSTHNYNDLIQSVETHIEATLQSPKMLLDTTCIFANLRKLSILVESTCTFTVGLTVPIDEFVFPIMELKFQMRLEGVKPPKTFGAS